MNEMIERVAKRLLDARIERGGPGAILLPWRSYPEDCWERRTARALIEAMRKPTEAMVEAARDIREYADDPDHSGLIRQDFEKEWRAAIDEAMK